MNEKDFTHDLSRNLTATLLENNYRIVNGIGRRFGTHLIGYANEYLAKQGVKDVEKHLIVRPFVSQGNNAAIEKRSLREEIISKCGTAIFVFGDQDGTNKSGVLEEFEIAYSQGKKIIPIAYPGMISETIWNIVKDNLTEYPYLEKELKFLTSQASTDHVSNIIVQILDSVQ